MRRLVDVERPAVGREGFQLGNDGDEHQEEGKRPAVHEARRAACHAVDVERTGGVVGEDDADQQEDGDYLRDDQVFDAGGQGPVVIREQNKAGGGDHREFEENEQVEDVAREDDAAQRHHGDEQYRHRAAAQREQGFLQVKGGEQAGQVDEQRQRGLGESHAQIDREGRGGAGGEDFNSCGVGGGEGPQPASRYPAHEGQRGQRYRVGETPPFLFQEPQQEGGRQRRRDDVEGAYHLSSVNFAMSSVCFFS